MIDDAWTIVCHMDPNTLVKYKTIINKPFSTGASDILLGTNAMLVTIVSTRFVSSRWL